MPGVIIDAGPLEGVAYRHLHRFLGQEFSVMSLTHVYLYELGRPLEFGEIDDDHDVTLEWLKALSIPTDIRWELIDELRKTVARMMQVFLGGINEFHTYTVEHMSGLRFHVCDLGDYRIREYERLMRLKNVECLEPEYDS